MPVPVAAETRGVNLGPAALIPPGEGRRFKVGETLIAVFRTRTGQVFATEALCPHKAGPLADGIVGAGKVVCPLHAYRFDLETGQPSGNDCRALKTYSARVNEDGDILVDLDVEPRDRKSGGQADGFS